MHKLSILSILLFILITSFSACRSSKIRKQTADELVIGLQQGILLVRLQTAERKAETLRQLGKPDDAEVLLNNQRSFNQKVRTAFQNHYDFSLVYFFHAGDSRQIRERKFANILYDAAEQPISADLLSNSFFLVAEFGEVQSPATNSGLNALIIMDEQLKQLSMPFPFATPTHWYLEEEIPNRTVVRLNLKLHDFYAKAQYRDRKRELINLRKNIQ